MSSGWQTRLRLPISKTKIKTMAPISLSLTALAANTGWGLKPLALLRQPSEPRHSPGFNQRQIRKNRRRAHAAGARLAFA